MKKVRKTDKKGARLALSNGGGKGCDRGFMPFCADTPSKEGPLAVPPEKKKSPETLRKKECLHAL